MSDFNEYANMKGQRRKNLNTKKTMAKKKGYNKPFGGCKGGNDSYLVNVFNDTMKQFRNGPQEKSILYNIENIPLAEVLSVDVEVKSNVENNDKVDNNNIVSNVVDNAINDNVVVDVSEIECIIEVKDMDTFDYAMDLCDQGYRPLVLNMASDYKPGGGVRSGKTAQEECLFRRSNAHLTHPEDWYPLQWNDVIFSPSVTIIKDSEYKLLPETYDVGMIAVAGIRKPRLINGLYSDDDRYDVSLKIESIFKIAIKHKYDSLVLGALGCGVFQNPPEEVASIFKVMINTYKKHFKKIVFAVLSVQSNENIRTFERIIL